MTQLCMCVRFKGNNEMEVKQELESLQVQFHNTEEKCKKKGTITKHMRCQNNVLVRKMDDIFLWIVVSMALMKALHSCCDIQNNFHLQLYTINRSIQGK